jgi:ABC-2 type transport system ATP-binding protein
MLLGLARPSSGAAYLLGERVPGHTMTRVGCLVERPALYPWMSGLANLRALAPGSSTEAVESALRQVGLDNAGAQRVTTYSLGMRQRLGVAAGILNGHEVLVLDEPANGLDPAGMRDFRNLFRELASQGKAILISSHQLNEVERACDRFVILNRGSVVADGPVNALGGNERWVGVTVDISQRDFACAILRRTFEVRSEGDGPLTVKAESGQEVARILAAADIYPEWLGEQKSTLEQRFLSLTSDAGSDATDD